MWLEQTYKPLNRGENVVSIYKLLVHVIGRIFIESEMPDMLDARMVVRADQGGLIEASGGRIGYDDA